MVGGSLVARARCLTGWLVLVMGVVACDHGAGAPLDSEAGADGAADAAESPADAGASPSDAGGSPADTGVADAADALPDTAVPPQDARADTRHDADAAIEGPDTTPDDVEGDAGSLSDARMHLTLTPAGSVLVGETLRATCLAHDANGDAIDGLRGRIREATERFQYRAIDDRWEAVAPGNARFECDDETGAAAAAESVEIEVEPVVLPILELLPLPDAVTAGQGFVVDCASAEGEALPAATRVEAHDANGLRVAIVPAGSELTLYRAGDHALSCAADDAVTGEAGPLTVVAAEPARLVVEPDSYAMRAGEWMEVVCLGLDAYGNETGEVEASELRLVYPAGLLRPPILDGRRARVRSVTELGYRYSCFSETTVPANEGVLDLTPNEATNWGGSLRANGQTINTTPMWVSPGSFVHAEMTPHDRQSNEIETHGSFVYRTVAIEPYVPLVGGGWIVDELGRYVVTVGWTGPGPLEDRVVEFYVDDGSPRMRCVAPQDAGWVTEHPGTVVSVAVEVADARTVERVVIGGAEAERGDDDLWRADHVVVPGINQIEAEAWDDLGIEGAVSCAFVAAGSFTAVDAPVEAASLALSEAALDDGDRAGPATSLADLLHGYASDPALEAMLHEALSAETAIYDGQLFLGTAPIDVVVRYLRLRGLSMPDSPAVEVRASNDEMVAEVRFTNIVVPISIQTSAFGSNSADVTLTSLTLEVRAGAVIDETGAGLSVLSAGVTGLGPMEASFDSTDGVLDDSWPFLEPDLRDDFRVALDGLLLEALGADLPGTVLDLSLSDELVLEPLSDDGVAARLRVGATLDRLSTPSGGLVLGLDAVIRGDAVARGPGVAHLAEAGPATEHPVTLTVGLDLLNAGLHRLWLEGFFEVTLYEFSELIEFAPGATVDNIVIRPDLPPTVSVRDGWLIFSLGSVYSDALDVIYGDGVLDTRFSADVAALPVLEADGRMSFAEVDVIAATMSLQPGTFTRSDYDSTMNAVLRQPIEDLVVDLLGAAVTDASFELLAGSDATAGAGLPAGSSFRFVADDVAATPAGIELRGRLAVVAD